MRRFILTLPLVFLISCVGINQGDPKLDPWKQLVFQCNVFEETLKFLTFKNQIKQFSQSTTRKMVNAARIIAPICRGEIVITDINLLLETIETELQRLIIMKGNSI